MAYVQKSLAKQIDGDLSLKIKSKITSILLWKSKITTRPKKKIIQILVATN